MSKWEAWGMLGRPVIWHEEHDNTAGWPIAKETTDSSVKPPIWTDTPELQAALIEILNREDLDL